MEVLIADLPPPAQSPMNMGGVIGIVIAACVVGLIWAFWNYLQVKKVTIGGGSTGLYESVVDGQDAVPEEQSKVIN